METDDEREILEEKGGGVGAGQIAPRRPGPCRARAGDGKATLWWSDDALDKDKLMLEEQAGLVFSRTDTYVVVKYRLDGLEWKEKGADARLEVKFPTTSVTVEGLTNGKSYQFAIMARNIKGLHSKESIRSNTAIPFQPLPEPWTEHFDKANGKTYYYNPETKQRTFKRPLKNSYSVSKENEVRFAPKDIKKMRLRFSEVDVDESGFIDEAELEELLKELDMDISRKKTRKLFRLIDKDKSGQIDFDEFLTLMHKLQHPSLLLQLLEPGRALKNAKDKVSGLVGASEKKKAKKRLEQKHKQMMIYKERMGPWVEKFDEMRRRKYYFNSETKEKVWTLPEEVLYYVPQELRDKFSEQNILDFIDQFDRFDADQSGEMDIDELTEAMRSLGDVIDHEQVVKLAEQVDVDGSGSINFSEFVQIMQIRRDRPGFLDKFKVLQGHNPQDKKQIVALKKEVFEVKQENKSLLERVQSLESETKFMRERKMIYVPAIPMKTFLAEHNLTQYGDALGQYGVMDTCDLFRLEDADYAKLDFKLGHKRKLIAALHRLTL